MQAFTDEKVNDPQIKSLMEKISIVAVPDSSILGLAAKVEVETLSGKRLQGFNDIMNEIPELETKRQKVQSKFMDLCVPVLGRKQSEEVMKAILILEGQEEYERSHRVSVGFQSLMRLGETNKRIYSQMKK